MKRYSNNEETINQAVVKTGIYQSTEWKKIRKLKLQQNPLCEECLKMGLITPAQCVHHRIWLTLDNVHNPEIALNMENLVSLCLQCHNNIHSRSAHQRYKIDSDGEIIDYIDENEEDVIIIKKNGGYK